MRLKSQSRKKPRPIGMRTLKLPNRRITPVQEVAMIITMALMAVGTTKTGSIERVEVVLMVSSKDGFIDTGLIGNETWVEATRPTFRWYLHAAEFYQVVSIPLRVGPGCRVAGIVN